MDKRDTSEKTCLLNIQHKLINTDDASEDMSIHEDAKQEEEELENRDNDVSEGVEEVYTEVTKNKKERIEIRKRSKRIKYETR